MNIPTYANNGTYGCVFRPGVSCKRKKSNANFVKYDRNTISKVFANTKLSKDEIKLHNQIVDKIDPEGFFTVKLLDKCNIETNNFPPAEIKKCKNFEQSDITKPKLPQILYEYGGFDLLKAARMFPFEEIFIALTRVFGGLVTMKQKGYVHLDIKPENMVYSDETKKLALIDFGLATTTNDLYIKENSNTFEHPYVYYPPEFPLIANKMAKIKICEEMQNTIYLIKYVDYWNKNFMSLYPSCPRLIAEVKNLYQSLIRNVEGDMYMPEKVDVYMLGASIIELFYICEKHNNTSIAMNPDFYTEVIRLCSGMIAISPSKRLSPEEAYEKYKLVVKKLRHDSPVPIKPSVVKMKKSLPEPQKKCPDGKVFNPITKRCNKVKVAKAPKVCPPGKILNPVTNRCIKERVPKAPKVCPPGKILNPVTKRCNKIKS